jgi:hypothetical protein
MLRNGNSAHGMMLNGINRFQKVEEKCLALIAQKNLSDLFEEVATPFVSHL